MQASLFFKAVRACWGNCTGSLLYVHISFLLFSSHRHQLFHRPRRQITVHFANVVCIVRLVADTPPWDMVFHTRVVVVHTCLLRLEACSIFLKRSRKIGQDGTWKAITPDELYGIM